MKRLAANLLGYACVTGFWLLLYVCLRTPQP